MTLPPNRWLRTATTPPIRVLHVDDQQGFADTTAAFLEQVRDAFEVETASSAEAGLERIEDGEFDCVVSDFEMPGVDGLEFLRRVRRSHPSLPFILFTGRGSEAVASDAISAGVTEYLQKRHGTEQFLLLANRIEQAVSRNRAERLMTRGFQAMDLANDGIALLDADGRFTFANRTFGELFGYHAAELVDEHWSLVVAEHGSDVGTAPVGMTDDSDWSGQLELQRKDGSTVVADLSFESTVNGGWVCLVTDAHDEPGRTRLPEREQHRLEMLVEAVRECATFALDTDGSVRTWNTGATRTEGDGREETVGEHFSTFHTDEAAEAGIPTELLARAKRDGSVRDESWRVRKDGSTSWPNVTLTATHDSDGELTGFGTVMRDLSQRHGWEEPLRLGEQSLAAAIDATEDVFYVLDTDFAFRWVNETLSSASGYTTAELESMRLLDLVVPAEREDTRVQLRQTLEEDDGATELTIRTRDGERIPFEVNQSQLLDESGLPIGIVGIGRDLSSRRARDRDLELQARQQQAVATLGYRALENAPLDELFDEAVRVVAETLDMDYCKVLDLDAGATELALRSGVGWQDGYVGEASVDNDHNSQAGYTVLSEEPVVVPDFTEETRFVSPPLLTEHDVSSGISVVIGSVDDPWGVLGVHDTEPSQFADTDVNFVQSVANILASAVENRSHRRRLERQNDQLETFARFLSHDLRNPLSVAQGRLELGRESCDDEHLAAVEAAHERIEAMIDELLSSARGDERGPTAGEVILSDVAEAAWDAVPTDDATLRIDADGRIGANPTQLQHVFENLFRNSVEHSSTSPRSHAREDSVEHSSTGNRTATPSGDSPEHGGSSVMVRAGMLDGDDGFYVEDDGPGIPDDERELIFEEGYTSSDDGTGFGLRIVEGIVDAHGWSVVAVDGTDGGARFEVRFG